MPSLPGSGAMAFDVAHETAVPAGRGAAGWHGGVSILRQPPGGARGAPTRSRMRSRPASARSAPGRSAQRRPALPRRSPLPSSRHRRQAVAPPHGQRSAFSMRGVEAEIAFLIGRDLVAGGGRDRRARTEIRDGGRPPSMRRSRSSIHTARRLAARSIPHAALADNQNNGALVYDPQRCSPGRANRSRARALPSPRRWAGRSRRAAGGNTGWRSGSALALARAPLLRGIAGA